MSKLDILFKTRCSSLHSHILSCKLQIWKKNLSLNLQKFVAVFFAAKCYHYNGETEKYSNADHDNFRNTDYSNHDNGDSSCAVKFPIIDCSK